jgi:hypothetical protein
MEKTTKWKKTHRHPVLFLVRLRLLYMLVKRLEVVSNSRVLLRVELRHRFALTKTFDELVRLQAVAKEERVAATLRTEDVAVVRRFEVAVGCRGVKSR